VPHIRIKTRALILIAVIASPLAIAVQAAVERQIIGGHVPNAVKNIQPIGRLESSRRLKLFIGLATRDEQGLDTFIEQLYAPSNANYHHYLSPEEFARRFGPAEEDYQTVIAYAKANGLNVTQQYSDRVVLSVEGAVADIEKALHVTMLTYPHPTESRTFYAPDAEPSVALTVPLLHIAGLNNYTLPHPKQKHHPVNRSANTAKSLVKPKEGSAPDGQLWGNDFRDAYVPGTRLTGAGQNLGLLEFEGYYAKDITDYEDAIGMSASNRPQMVIVPLDGGATPEDGDDNGEEASGDIEMAVSMAPGLSNIYVFESDYASFDEMFASMVTYTNISQFSCSWGGDDSKDPTSEVLFKQMATQGQSFFNASGDDGAFVGDVEFPSDSPSIMQVGGTTMTDGSAPSYPWRSEVVWNWGLDEAGNYLDSSAGATSGGISTYYAIPSWQSNSITTANAGSKTMRNIPDIAANADNAYLYTDDGQKSGGYGGTSDAAPLWAAFTALVNQQAAACGRQPVGFLNPALYALASTTSYASLFHDITSGENTWDSSPSKFYAVAGYDLCCGLGSMNGTNLINALAPPVSPPSFLPTLSTANGLTLVWSTASGFSYQVQYTTDLTTTNWINLGSAITASGSTATISDNFADSQRFYRVLQLQ
jgi:subtilase family serine protease